MKTEVFDLINAGPRHRFTVRGKDGRPFIVSNCVQWTARMIFAELQLNLHRKLQAEDPRQRVLFTVHDEAVTEVDTEGRKEQLERDMSISPGWIPDIPLGAEAHIVDRYLK